VQRLNDFLGQQAIGLNGHEHIGRFDADFEVLKIQALKVLYVTQC
jgi:hypothetical protein